MSSEYWAPGTTDSALALEQKMYAGSFAADFGETIQFLTACQDKRGTTRSLAAIVIAHESSEIAGKSLLPYLEYWHYRSEDAVDLVFPGYVGDPSLDEYRTRSSCNFDASAFAEVVATFEKRCTWTYTGQPCVLLLSAGRHSLDEEVKFDYREAIDFDLSQAIKEGDIESAPVFFETLIRVCCQNEGLLNQNLLSDVLGARTVSSALLASLCENIPLKGIRRAASAAGFFRLK